MKNKLMMAILAVAFTATAFAATPSQSDARPQLAPEAAAETILPSADGGVYDAAGLQCVASEQHLTAGPQETRCWKCGDGSKGSCSGGDKYCYGERSDCSRKGCRITGSTSQCTGSKKRNQC